MTIHLLPKRAASWPGRSTGVLEHRRDRARRIAFEAIAHENESLLFRPSCDSISNQGLAGRTRPRVLLFDAVVWLECFHRLLAFSARLQLRTGCGQLWVH